MPDQMKPARSPRATPQVGGPALNAGFLTDVNERAVAYWARSLSALTQEMTQFVEARLQEDTGAWFGLASCRNLTDIVECQRRYAEKATADYLDEYRKLSQIVLNLTNESFTPARGSEGRAPD